MIHRRMPLVPKAQRSAEEKANCLFKICPSQTHGHIRSNNLQPWDERDSIIIHRPDLSAPAKKYAASAGNQFLRL
jgi:hypothetical protein